MRQLFAAAAAAGLVFAAGAAQAANPFAASATSKVSGTSSTVTSTHAGTIGTSDANGSASATLIFSPAPGVKASASISPSASESLSTAYTADAEVDYDLIVHPGANFTTEVTEVPLALSGVTSFSRSGFGDATGKIVYTDAQLNSDVTNFICNTHSHSGCGSSPFTIGYRAILDDLGIFVGQISLKVRATASEFPDSASAMIDPILTIDPDFLILHPGTTLELSPGIGNGDQQGGVPEPASWALLIAGFGLAGANLRRRRAARA